MIPLRSRILPIRNAKHWKILLHSICYGNGKDTKGVEGMAENKPMDIVEKPTKNETVCEKSRGDRTRELFREGYNCSQAVTLAFAEELEASYKAAEEAAPEADDEADPVWAELKQQMDDKTVLTVKIGGVVNGGVIAYVEGIRGFIPASRLSLEHVDDLNEWLNKKVRVRVITVDPEKKRLVLSAREILRAEARAAEDEKKKAAFEQVHVGDVMDGTVETLKDYGAFVRLSNGLSGLVHVSQISDKRVVSPDKVLKEGQEVKVKVTAIKDGKLSLSMKALLESAQEEEANEHYEIPKSENIATSLGSLLKNIKL